MTTDETRVMDDMGETTHRLSAGWHDDLEQGYCLLEYHWLRRYAALHNCTFADAVHHMPKGDPLGLEEIVLRHVIAELNDVSPALTMAAFKLNDALLADGPYQRSDLEPRLRALEPLLTNTDRLPDADSKRALIALAWLIREYLPAWLWLTPALASSAEDLAALPALTGPMADYVAAERRVRATRVAVSAVMAGIPSPGWDAASDAAQAAGVYVAWDAAEIGDAAITAAVAADYAAEAAEAAARIAIKHMEPADATALLRPTVSALQDGALALFTRLLAVREE